MNKRIRERVESDRIISVYTPGGDVLIRNGRITDEGKKKLIADSVDK